MDLADWFSMYKVLKIEWLLRTSMNSHSIKIVLEIKKCRQTDAFNAEFVCAIIHSIYMIIGAQCCQPNLRGGHRSCVCLPLGGRLLFGFLGMNEFTLKTSC